MTEEKKFKIGVIGHGFVGRAIVQGFEFIADIKIYDKFKPVDSLEDVFHYSNIIFVSVPTPQGDDGVIDLSTMDEVMENLNRLNLLRSTTEPQKIIAIKSTVVPGTTDNYQKKYPSLKVIHNPEFLTERTALLDFINSNRVVLGGDKEACEKVAELYRARMNAPIFITDAKSAEMVKYTCNCFFATKIGFFNEIYKLCEKLGIKYDDVQKMVLADGRIGNSHMDVPGHDGKFGWGGHCFLKDTKALYNRAKELGVDLEILEAAIESNKKIRGGDVI